VSHRFIEQHSIDYIPIAERADRRRAAQADEGLDPAHE
jgi:hypothetical protein